MTNDYDPDMLDELLPIYYRKLFPYKPYMQWICGGNFINDEEDLKIPDKNYVSRREFCFTLKEDIYIRYLSFSSAEDLKEAMVGRVPHKIDIGAIFNVKPSDHKKVTNFQPLEKELVFDIDLTDYDDVRTCCGGAKICEKCWQFMIVAVKILDRTLTEDFGFKSLLWVYSGRRGIHCWVSDKNARQLSQSGRSAVAEYLQILTGGDAKSKKINLKSDGSLHPSIQKSLDIINSKFDNLCIKDQDILGTPELWQKVLALINDESIRSKLHETFPSKKNSEERWQVLKTFASDVTLNEIKLQFAYPRLDINVSKGLNHLLKSPFCVHPKTGRVCIPFNPKKVDDFNPEHVPTVNQLIDELDKSGKEDKENSNNLEYNKTSLKKPMKVFNDFLQKMSGQQFNENQMDF